MREEIVDLGHITRIHDSVLAERERGVLVWLVSRMPTWVTPDMLTSVGVAGSFLIALGCVAAHMWDGFLLVSLVGLAINWFGDSTDGTLARFRKIERPRYGFFVDQVADVTSHFLMLLGLGLSPLMRLDTALLALLASLAIMFYGHLKLQFSRTWQVSFHGVGPTEFRLLIGAGLIASYFGLLPRIETPHGVIGVFDLVSAMVFLAALVVIARLFILDRAKLAKIDPIRHQIPPMTVVRDLSNN